MVGMRASGAPPAAVLAGLFGLVVVTDQAAKWLAWRHLRSALINQGGFIALRPGVRAWFAAPTAGAIADVIGVVVVVAAVALLLRRPRRRSVLVGAGLVAAGWTSNLLDRFGLHELTAPGSVRGVVDFIPSGGRSRANVADLWILAGLAVLLVAFSRRRTVTAAPLTVTPGGRPRR